MTSLEDQLTQFEARVSKAEAVNDQLRKDLEKANEYLNSQKTIVATFQQQFVELEADAKWARDLKALLGTTSKASGGNSTMNIEKSETEYNITGKPPAQYNLSTETTLGKVMYVLVVDRKGQVSTVDEITDELTEYGRDWQLANETVRLTCLDAAKKGLVVRDSKPGPGGGVRYRLPTKLKVTPEGEPAKP